MKKVLLLVLLMLFLYNVKSYTQPWGHRYSAVQSDQNITANPDDSFKVSVEWGEGDWTSSSFGYGIVSNDVTNWIWVDLPYFQDGEGSNKRCSTNVSINIPGKYYYAYRMIKNDQTSYSFGSVDWIQNSTTLNATSTITINGSYSVSNGNWSENSIWNGNTLPTNDSIVGIHNDVTLNQDAEIASINVGKSGEFTASDATARTLTISDGGTLTNNGTFTAGTGKVVFAGAGAVAGSSATTFNDVEIQGGVNFGSSSNLDGTLTVNGGFAVTNSITYNSGSTLKYSTAYTINSGDVLWFPNTASTGVAQKGVPWNVEIDVIVVQLNDNFPFYMNGSLLNNGTFRLGTASDPNFGDLYLRGNFTDNGTFNANSRTTFFNGTALQTIDGSSNTTFAFLNIAANAQVEVDSEKKITTSSGLQINSPGSFTLKSDGAGTASLITNGAATGNVTVERYMDEASKAATWHYVSSPVSGQDIDNTWMANNSIISSPSYQLFRYDEPLNYWIIYGSTGNPAAFGDAQFGAAKGYTVARNGAGAISFTGTVRTDDVTYPATYNATGGKGWNLIGNPFTSSIGITSDASSSQNFLTVNTGLLDDNYEAIFIWDESTDYSGNRNDYKVIGNPIVTGFNTINQDYIQPGQAFMVKVSSGGNLQFNEAMQYHADVAFYKSKEYWPSVELVVQGQGVANTTAIGFHDDMTAGLDPSFDVGKLKGNPDLALYTRLVEDNGVDFAIQALPIDELESYEIPVGLDISTSGVYEFSANQINFDQYNIVLEDRKENVFTNLRWDTYFAQINEGGLGRFYLHFKDATNINSPAPLQKPLVSFINGELLVTNAVEGKVDVRAVDITGRVVAMQKFQSADAVHLPLNVRTGIYIVEVAAENGKFASKIYVE